MSTKLQEKVTEIDVDGDIWLKKVSIQDDNNAKVMVAPKGSEDWVLHAEKINGGLSFNRESPLIRVIRPSQTFA